MSSEHRVLLVQESYLPSVGGAELHVYHIARCLREQGRVVRIATATPGPAHESGVPVDRVPAFSHQGRRAPLTFLQTLPGVVGRVAATDVVHGHCTAMMSAMHGMAARVLRRRYVVTLHGFGTLDSSVDKSVFGRVWRWLAIRLAHKVIATTPEMRDIALRFVEPARIELITNGVDTDMFERRDRVAHEEFRIAAVRRLVPKNGVHYLIEALPSVIARSTRPVVATLAGEGALRDHIERRIAKLGLGGHVRVLGTVPNDQVRDVIYDSDVVVFPSSAEGFSLAALEAMACGRAVVASSVGGFPDMLGEGRFGVLVGMFDRSTSDYDAPLELPADKIALLADALVELEAHDSRLDDLGFRAAEHVRAHYDWRVITAHVVCTYSREKETGEAE